MGVRDRVTGALVEEPLPHGPLLRAAYAPGPWLAGAAGPWLSEVVGWAARQRWSARQIPGFIVSQGVDPSTVDRAPSEYPSLDAFFSRPIPEGARPLDPDPAAVASPCDGTVRVWEAVGAEDRLPVKGHTPTLKELLGDASLAGRLDGASVALLRLAPGDLHRVVLPTSGVLEDVIALGGPLHSVHPVAVDAGAPALLNRRVVVPVGTSTAVVAIGALNVGSVELLARPGPATRGEELAVFHLGGSAVVVVGQGIAWDPDLLEATARGEETRVRLGERLGLRSSEANILVFPSQPRRRLPVEPAPEPPPAGAPTSWLQVLDPPNLVTLASLGIAFAAVIAALHGSLRPAFVLLGASAVLDGVDGALARRFHHHVHARRLGRNLDLLVDGAAFGLTPAVLLHQAGMHGPIELLVLTALPVAVVLRLAWFAAWGRGDRFRGLPSTTTGVLLPAVGLLVLIDVDAFRLGATALASALVIGMLAPVEVRRPGWLGRGLLVLLGLATVTAWILL